MGGLDRTDFLTEGEWLAALKKRDEEDKRWRATAKAMHALRLKYGHGSQYRFHKRLRQWRDSGARWPLARYVFWWFVHNSLAHLAIAVLPVRWTFRFHDYTSKKLNITPGFA